MRRKWCYVARPNSLSTNPPALPFRPRPALVRHADTAEFLLTRGPYALLGYSWCGCTNGQQMRPRAKEWDDDYGEPLGVCKETSPGSGVFEREWTGATVQWNCNAGDGAQHGTITRK